MEIIPGSKHVRMVPETGKPPSFRCAKHNKFLLPFLLQRESIIAQVCGECLEESGAQMETAGVRQVGGRMVPRLSGVNYVSQPKKFICKSCLEDFHSFQDMQDHDCVVGTMGVRPPA